MRNIEKVFPVAFESLDGIDPSEYTVTDWKAISPETFEQIAENLPSGFVLYLVTDNPDDTYIWWIDRK